MSCCGNKRAEFQISQALDNRNNRTRPQPSQPTVRPPAKVFFEYSGQVPVRVVGAVSGNHYRFSGPGARLEIDARDRRSLAAIPKFRQVW
jgi:hypothetical protein